ncbi:ATP-binding protein [Vibrio sp. RE88]|uniref:ATP-binding protein n=1 Tax=Vibrio sp. RE88 TaxID=2607610 RepID=UPI00149336DF|nr:ATP-binding protein [Vibrio sp. RE88]NOH60645.1 response regulator [Vibrio sp. RE88]
MKAHLREKSRRYFVATIATLCTVLICVIVYVFYSLAEIKNISPDPYVTIINNNISVKTKLLSVKTEILQYSLNKSSKGLSNLKFKARVYKSSIMQDLLSERTNKVHEKFGDVEELREVVAQIDSFFDMVNRMEADLSTDHVLIYLDSVYSRLNVYLAGFVSEVQRSQSQFNRYKESFYDRQYVYLGIILVCSMLMTGVISRMYLSQTRLSSDLSDRTKVMEEAKKSAEQSSVAKARFLANMSHEMRTPLNAIIGLSQKEYYEGSDEQTRQFLSMINRSGDHLLKLINNVLDLSKIEQGKSKLEQEDFYLSELVDISKTVFINFDKKHDVEVFFSLSLESNFKIRSDRTKLVQIINNLGYNAIKFTASGYVDINVALRREGQSGQLIITVKDTGIGMAAEQLEKVFQEFTQGDDSITRKYGGTGLGLSICQSLASLLGGTIDVRSVPDAGSEFTVDIPVEIVEDKPLMSASRLLPSVRVVSENHYAAELITSELQQLGLYDPEGEVSLCFLSHDGIEDDILHIQKQSNGPIIVYGNINTHPSVMDNLSLLSKPYDLFSLIQCLEDKGQTHQQAEQVPTAERNGGLSVMVVEDIRMNQIVAAKMLMTLEAQVTTANNGQECLDLLHEQHFDIIFMDIQMPVMDGLEALRQIKQRNLAPDTAIIALTANTFESDVQNYLQQGFDNVLPKPFKLDWLRGMLNKYCASC